MINYKLQFTIIGFFFFILINVSAGWYVWLTLQRVEKALPVDVLHNHRRISGLLQGLNHLVSTLDAVRVDSTEERQQEFRLSLDIVFALLDDLHSDISRDNAETLSIITDEIEQTLEILDNIEYSTLSKKSYLLTLHTRLSDTVVALKNLYLYNNQQAFDAITVQVRQIGNLKFSTIVIISLIAISLIGMSLLLIFRNRAIRRLKTTQRELNNSKIRSQAIFEQAPVGIVRISALGKCIRVNQKFCEILGFSQSEALNKSLLDMIHQDDLGQLALFIEHLSGKQTLNNSFEKRFIKKDGTIVWTNLTISRLDENILNSQYLIAVIEDITERKKFDKTLLEARDSAEKANQAKSVFLANMSHEIRTPMNAILGFSQIMLRDSDISLDQKENVRTIWRSGEHLLTLINDILEMSKIEAGRTELNPRSFDLLILLKDLEMMFKVRTDEKNLELSFERDEQVPRYVYADEGKLRQILINLLGNAAKFTAKGGIKFRLKFDQKEAQLIFEIEDTGFGISKRDILKVFENFEQTSDHRKKEGGTGLGLAISKKYAILMNGDITVDSEPEKGSIFSFRMPFLPGDLNKIESTISHQRVVGIQPGQNEIRVLIADDRATNRTLLIKILESVGFVTLEAVNGKEAVEIFQSWKPQLILMDMIMPEMNGLEAIQKIRQLPSGTKTVIFAVTASVLEEEKKVVLQHGAVEFIKKPFRVDELFSLIAKHLGVKYEYENRELIEGGETQEIHEDTEISQANPLTTVSLANIPSDLINQMNSMAEIGNRRELFNLIDQINPEEKVVADCLRDFADNYEYEKIVELFNQLD
jgi:PAS domain S-box-containing protein